MFELVSDYQPAGDQPQAIAKLTSHKASGAFPISFKTGSIF